MDKAAAALARMKGPVVPLNLCFDETGALDHQAVAAYVDWLSEQGAPILMLTYGSSEFACLDDEDIWAVTETVGQACAGRAFCIGGTGFWKAAKTRDYLAHAQAVGMDAVKVQVHPYLGNTTPVLINYFDALEGAADIPLLAVGRRPAPLPLGSCRGTSPAPPHHWHEERRRPILHVLRPNPADARFRFRRDQRRADAQFRLWLSARLPRLFVHSRTLPTRHCQYLLPCTGQRRCGRSLGFGVPL